MIYNRSPDIEWAGLPDDAAFELLPHFTLDYGKQFLLLARQSPGWAFVTPKVLQLIQGFDGKLYSELRSEFASPDVALGLSRLYAVGLLAVGGATGLTGTREHKSQPLSQNSVSTGDLIQIEPRKPRVARGNAIPHAVPHTLLIKLTGACNWACTYCYDYSPGRFKKRLTLDDLRGVIGEMVSQHSTISLMFHGGEPLLNFDEVCRITEHAEKEAKKFQVTLFKSIQTNGSLLDDEKINFLREHEFGVGMSIDGPPEINDLTRIDHQGLGTGSTMLRLFEQYPDFMTKEVGYITTVTTANVERLKEIAEYLRGLGVRTWNTAIFDVEGRAESRPDLEVPVEPYIEFMEWAIEQCTLGRWKGFRVRAILDLLGTMTSHERSHLCLKFPCGAGRDFAAVAADKQILACDAAYSPAFALGSVESGLRTSQHSITNQALSAREAWLLEEAECAQCPWLHFCAGTCMAKALLKHSTIKAVDDFECAVRKRIFPLLFRKLAEKDSGLARYHRDSRVGP